MKRHPMGLALVTLCLALLFTWSTASAHEIPVVTGEHWLNATEKEKKAFLIGMGTILVVEREWHGNNPPPDEQSFIPRMIRGLSHYTLTQVMENLDRWYRAHPDRLDRPVIQTLWFEMVLPNLATASKGDLQ